jgi:hypothetical protein
VWKGNDIYAKAPPEEDLLSYRAQILYASNALLMASINECCSSVEEVQAEK